MRALIRTVLLLLLSLAFIAPAMAKEEAHGEKKEGEEVGPQFVPVGPLTIPIVRNGRIFQYVRISVKLETKDAEDAQKITDRLPSLNDAYLTNLYGAFYVGDGVQGPLVDLDKVRERLTLANKSVLPEGIVQNILIQQVSQTMR